MSIFIRSQYDQWKEQSPIVEESNHAIDRRFICGPIERAAAGTIFNVRGYLSETGVSFHVECEESMPAKELARQLRDLADRVERES